MPQGQNVVAIIPARGGSKGLPRRNLRVLAGKPLIAYSIEAAKASALVDRVIVSTDDEEIAGVAQRCGAEVPFIRPSDLATDDATTESVLQHAVEWLEHKEAYRVDIVVFLQSTDVFRKRGWIDEVVTELLADPLLDSAFVGYATHKNFWKKEGNRFVHASHRDYGPRQKKQPIYREDTGLACATRSRLVKDGLRIGEHVKIIETQDFCTSIDIHDEFDLWLAEHVITKWGTEPNS